MRPEDYTYLPVPLAVGRNIPRRMAMAPKLVHLASGHQVQRLMGFWFCWHALGGLDGIIASGLWSRSGAYEQLAQFRKLYECTPDELLPDLGHGITKDAANWPARYPPRNP